MSSKNSLRKQINTTQQSNLRLRYRVQTRLLRLLDTTIYKGQWFYKESVLDMRTHFKPTETLQYTFFTSCHPPGVKKGFVNGEALRLLRTNSSLKTFEENITKFTKHLIERGYKILLTTHSQKRSLNKGHKPSSNETKQKNESCPSWHNTTRQFQISKKPLRGSGT